MLAVLKRMWPFGGSSDAASSPAMAALVTNLHYEVIPMPSIEQAIDDLPPGAHVSVTCSPVNGIAATQEYAARLHTAGFVAVPHFAARMVGSPEHAAELASWARRLGLEEVYVVAGDAPEAHGPYEGALAFMRDFLAADPGVSRVGIAGYPDGHPLIAPEVLDEQLPLKQALLEEFGVGGWISTQMCFDERTIRDWISTVRARGITLPIRLGVPGVVDRARLMRVGTRLGIGASLRFLSKNTSTVMKLMAPGGFDPTEMVVAFADDADRLGIEALHSFTFNSVADTRAWQEAIVAGGTG
jgi:methylenetetrahydrofolate reductase (NADPH)